MTTTYDDLTITLATDTGITTTAIETALDTYIEQIESLENRDIDRDDITDEDEEFLTEAIRAAIHNGEMGGQEVERLSDIAAQHRDAEDALAEARADLDRAIIAATNAGARQVDIAQITGLSVATIRRIANG
jgi:DNA-directed RNA polymerase specialized sigma24 family protein